MNEQAFGAADIVATLTEQEMEEMVGGDTFVGHLIGYALGYAAGFIVNTATNVDMQPYCFGA